MNTKFISKNVQWTSIRSIVILLFTLFATEEGIFAQAKYPFPQNQEQKFGTVYKGMNVSSTVQGLYNQWLTNYYTEGKIDLTDCARIKTQINISQNDTVTTVESIAEAMLIMVFMDNDALPTKNRFDKLWMYYNKNLNENGFMYKSANSFTGNSVSGCSGSVTGADVTVAMALLLADKQWGAEQATSYGTEALNLINKIWEFEVDKTRNILKAGDAQADYINPSYFNNAALRLFAIVDASHNWESVIEGNYALLTQTANDSTGLIPDWSMPDGSYIAGTIDNTYESYFLYEAIRVPWLLALDYCWNGDQTAKSLSETIANWVIKKTGGDLTKVVDGYLLNGNVFDNPDQNPNFDLQGKYGNPAFIAGLSIGSMVNESGSSLLNDCWYTGSQVDPYGNMTVHTLQLLYMLALTGNMNNFYEFQPKIEKAFLVDGELKVIFNTTIDATTVANSVNCFKVFVNGTEVSVSEVIFEDYGNYTNKSLTLTGVNSFNTGNLKLVYNCDSQIKSEEGKFVLPNDNIVPLFVGCLGIIGNSTDVEKQHIIIEFCGAVDATTIDIIDFEVTSNGVSVPIKDIQPGTENTKLIVSFNDGITLNRDEDVIITYDGWGSLRLVENATVVMAFSGSVQFPYCASPAQISFVQDDITLHPGQDTIVTLEIEPEDAEIDEVIVNISYNAPFTVGTISIDSLKITAKESWDTLKGQITVEFSGCSNETVSTLPLIITIEPDDTFLRSVSGSEVLVYPNPATSQLVIRGEGICSVKIVDMSGNVVLENTEAAEDQTINVESLAAGMYLLHLQTAQGIVIKEFSKK